MTAELIPDIADEPRADPSSAQWLDQQPNHCYAAATPREHRRPSLSDGDCVHLQSEDLPNMETSAEVTVPWRGMLIDGQIVDASSGACIESVNPATERVIGKFPHATESDVDHSVAAAHRASGAWRDLSAEDRASLLHEYARRILENADEIAMLDAMDSGNPIVSMRADIRSAAREIRYFANLATETKGRTFPSSRNLTYTEFVPYPVVARIVPFNHPAKFVAAKVSAPLAAGCCVVVKPGEQASLSALRLAELAKDVFPAGVLNIVTGAGGDTGAALAGHRDVPRVAFTGSVSTGARVAVAGAATFTHVTLELGGKNPMVIFPDADPVEAAHAAVSAMNFARSMGQSCGSTSRAFIHEDIKDEFLKALIDRVGQLKVGDPLDPSTDMGPLAYASHYARVNELIASAISDGATLSHGGKRPEGLSVGYYLEPTVFTDVTMSMQIAREEVFGPVLSVLTWSDYEDLISQVNMLDLGLTANIWTNDISRAISTARRIESGYVSINGSGQRQMGAPFGGFKASGMGKESSIDELLSYGREKTVLISLNP